VDQPQASKRRQLSGLATSVAAFLESAAVQDGEEPRVGRFLTVIGSWLGAIAGLDWLWKQLNVQEIPVIWAFTVATFFAIAYLGSWVCAWRISIYEARVDDCANAKGRLEQQILKNRRSSRKTS
jgi:hypothetical protein